MNIQREALPGAQSSSVACPLAILSETTRTAFVATSSAGRAATKQTPLPQLEGLKLNFLVAYFPGIRQARFGV